MENKKTAIITGANGFIGSALTRYLCGRGAEVWALIQKGADTGMFQGCACVHTVPFSLEHTMDSAALLPQGADLFYHFAWKGVSGIQKNDPDTQLQNIQFSLDTLRLAQQLHANKIIFAGSVSEYAYNGKAVTGDDPPAPSDFYAAAKAAARVVCGHYACQNKLPFIWTLISSIYGPGRRDNNLITYAITSLLKGERPVFTKLEQVWDYIYIDDLIHALYLVGLHGESGKTYPIGSGEEKQLSEYVASIRNAIDPTLPVGIGEIPYKTNRIDHSVINSEPLRELGFSPCFSFEQGIALTIDYFRHQQ